MRKKVTIMEALYFADMSSRGRQSSEIVIANCLLIKRRMEANRYPMSQLEGQISKYLGPYLKGKGPPMMRTVQEWENRTPNFPETALSDGILTEEKDILSDFRSYLRREEFHAELHQEISSNSSRGSGFGAGEILAGSLVGYFVYRVIRKVFRPTANATSVEVSQVGHIRKRISRSGRRSI